MRFSFQDLVFLRTAGGLAEAGLTPRRIRRALSRLREPAARRATADGGAARGRGRPHRRRGGRAPVAARVRSDPLRLRRRRPREEDRADRPARLRRGAARTARPLTPPRSGTSGDASSSRLARPRRSRRTAGPSRSIRPTPTRTSISAGCCTSPATPRTPRRTTRPPSCRAAGRRAPRRSTSASRSRILKRLPEALLAYQKAIAPRARQRRCPLQRGDAGREARPVRRGAAAPAGPIGS